MKSYELIDVINQMIGRTEFSGEHGVDMDRVENIKELGALTQALTEQLMHLTRHKDDYRSSAQAIANEAMEQLSYIRSTAHDGVEELIIKKREYNDDEYEVILDGEEVAESFMELNTLYITEKWENREK